jgi:hypothetical protein
MTNIDLDALQAQAVAQALMVARAAINGVLTHPFASMPDREKALGVALNALDEIEDARIRELEGDTGKSAEAWQPIETAPKDELILVGPTKRMGICVAMNHGRDGWVTETPGDWFGIYTPTEWKPLPAAPSADRAAPEDDRNWQLREGDPFAAPQSTAQAQEE